MNLLNPESLVGTQREGRKLDRLRGFHLGDWLFESKDELVRVGAGDRFEPWWDVSLAELLSWGPLPAWELSSLVTALRSRESGPLSPATLVRHPSGWRSLKYSLGLDPLSPDWAGFLAPETLRDNRPAEAFSLASILHCCLTGRLPFAGSTPLAIVGAVLAGHLDLDPGLPPELMALLRAGLHSNPAERPGFNDLLRPFTASAELPLETIATLSPGPATHLSLGWDQQSLAWIEAGVLMFKPDGKTARDLGSGFEWATLSPFEPVLLARSGSEIVLMGLPDGRLLHSWTVEGPAQAVGASFAPDGHLLAAPVGNDLLLLGSSGLELGKLVGQAPVMATAFSPDSSRLGVCSADQTLSIWELDNRSLERVHGWRGYDLAWENGRVLTGWSDRLEWLDPQLGSSAPEGARLALKRLAVEGQNRAWLDQLRGRLEVETSRGRVEAPCLDDSLVLVSRGYRVLTAGQQGVRLWAVGRAAEIQAVESPAHDPTPRPPGLLFAAPPLVGVTVSSDLSTFATCTDQGMLVGRLEPAETLAEYKTSFLKVLVSPRGNWVVALTAERSLRVWHTRPWRELELGLEQVADFDLRRGRLVVARGPVQVFNLEHQELELHLEPPIGQLVRLSSQADRLALTDGERVRIWDFASGWLDCDLRGQQLAWSGHFLASLDHGRACVWPQGLVLPESDYRAVRGDPHSPMLLFTGPYQMTAWDPAQEQQAWLGAPLDVIDFTLTGQLVVRLPEGPFLLDAPWAR
ncbi:MAG: hypothetical protein KC910_00415 [Candidatus Eremiobacteraeota bacterium]|nr:hypothetical protein [Candidatus Eremiobacteraeota bacterium]